MGQICHKNHDTPAGAHFGVDGMSWCMKQRNFWKIMWHHTQWYVAGCNWCHQTNHQSREHMRLLQPLHSILSKNKCLLRKLKQDVHMLCVWLCNSCSSQLQWLPPFSVVCKVFVSTQFDKAAAFWNRSCLWATFGTISNCRSPAAIDQWRGRNLTSQLLCWMIAAYCVSCQWWAAQYSAWTASGSY